MVKTHIVMPVRDQLHLTQSICENLKTQIGWDVCWIFNNGSTDGTGKYLDSLWKEDRRFQYVDTPGWKIYEMWDKGFAVAKKHGADYVAILNNDLELFPNTIQILSNALSYNKQAWIAYPDYNSTESDTINYRITQGTYRHGGMSGFCFMLRAEQIDWSPLVDPQFTWWGGDDDIAFTVEKAGGQQIRVLGLPVTHLVEGTARHHDLGAQKGADLAAVIKKWGR